MQTSHWIFLGKSSVQIQGRESFGNEASPLTSQRVLYSLTVSPMSNSWELRCHQIQHPYLSKDSQLCLHLSCHYNILCRILLYLLQCTLRNTLNLTTKDKYRRFLYSRHRHSHKIDRNHSHNQSLRRKTLISSSRWTPISTKK